MSSTKTRNLIIGILFLTVSMAGFAAVYTVLYRHRVSEQVITSQTDIPSAVFSEEKISTEQALLSDPTPTALKNVSSEPAGPEINLAKLVNEAKAVYAPEEVLRQDGLLWVDVKNKQFVVTLGAMNGVLPGDRLVVYDKRQKIGEVEVSTAFDSVSYVRPLSASMGLAAGNYYEVIANIRQKQAQR